MLIGERVAALMRLNGWTYAEVAKRVRAAGAGNVKYQHVQQLVTHPKRKPSFLPELAAAFDMSVEEFLVRRPKKGINDSASADAQRLLSESDEPGPTSPTLRLEILILALQEAAHALEGKHPTPNQQARLVTLLYELIEDGMPLAQVKQVARRAAPVSIATGERSAGSNRNGTAD